MLGFISSTEGQSASTAPLHYSVGWIGNSFSGKDAWVLQDVDDLCVLPDGTIYTNVGWDEAGGNVQQYRDGKLIAVAGHTHGWGYGGGQAIAANDRYVFIGQQVDSEGGGLKGNSWPEKGLVWSGISRRTRSDIRAGAPFPDGRGKEGDVLQGSFLPVAEYSAGQAGAIRGLCADSRRLYVSSPYDNQIKVYDPETMDIIGSWNLDHPDKICLEDKDHLWALQRPEAYGGQWAAQRFLTTGKATGQRILFPAGVVPSAMCVDDKGRLVVADRGAGNQVLRYGNLATSPALNRPSA